jgi:hypothetical protein
MTDQLTLNRHQLIMHSVDPKVSIADLAGRGCGKSYGAATLMLRGVETYGRDYKALYIRQTYKGLKDFETILLDVFTLAYGPNGFRYNQSEHVLSHPSGAYIEMGEMADQRSFAKYQGRSFVEAYIDECQQFAEPRLIDLLRSNLRSAKTPTRMILLANPLGSGHGWLKTRFIDTHAPGVEFQFGKVPWVRLSGTYQDNELIDQGQYADNITAATIGDKARRQAWLEGRFDVDSGAFFTSSFSEARNVIDISPESLPNAHLFEYRLAHDWGYAAPAVTLLLAENIEGNFMFDRYVPRGSVLVLDEHTSAVPGSLSEGRRLSIPDLSEEIHAMQRQWPYSRPRGVADDAISSPRGDSPKTFREEFERCGIFLKPAKKGERIASLQRLIRYLAAAKQTDEPCLLINRRCGYLLRTLPMIVRDENNPEDIDKNCNFDHALDALRYGLTQNKRYEGYLITQEINLW